MISTSLNPVLVNLSVPYICLCNLEPNLDILSFIGQTSKEKQLMLLRSIGESLYLGIAYDCCFNCLYDKIYCVKNLLLQFAWFNTLFIYFAAHNTSVETTCERMFTPLMSTIILEDLKWVIYYHV